MLFAVPVCCAVDQYFLFCVCSCARSLKWRFRSQVIIAVSYVSSPHSLCSCPCHSSPLSEQMYILTPQHSLNRLHFTLWKSESKPPLYQSMRHVVWWPHSRFLFHLYFRLHCLYFSLRAICVEVEDARRDEWLRCQAKKINYPKRKKGVGYAGLVHSLTCSLASYSSFLLLFCFFCFHSSFIYSCYLKHLFSSLDPPL